MFTSCISFDSYIKPQPACSRSVRGSVVYLLIPTSNHNLGRIGIAKEYVVYLLIPTSNHNSVSVLSAAWMLYIFWFLHQTTTVRWPMLAHCRLYIFWFLHQTTTFTWFFTLSRCCISFDSYIKPQHSWLTLLPWMVVYLLIPTSNHIWCGIYLGVAVLYIFWFLHQTTTMATSRRRRTRCISFDSYIKPQLSDITPLKYFVVYLLIPTSNHNCHAERPRESGVVYLLIPTSNHNKSAPQPRRTELYIFWFLHQTTTTAIITTLKTPLYIFWFLHQTTTVR